MSAPTTTQLRFLRAVRDGQARFIKGSPSGIFQPSYTCIGYHTIRSTTTAAVRSNGWAVLVDYAWQLTDAGRDLIGSDR